MHELALRLFIHQYNQQSSSNQGLLPRLASCAVLEEWIKRPAGFALPDQPTYGDFQLDPVWDSLRGYPRFDALVSQLAPTADR